MCLTKQSYLSSTWRSALGPRGKANTGWLLPPPLLFETWLNLTAADKDLRFLWWNAAGARPHPDPITVCKLIVSLQLAGVYLHCSCGMFEVLIWVYSELKLATKVSELKGSVAQSRKLRKCSYKLEPVYKRGSNDHMLFTCTALPSLTLEPQMQPISNQTQASQQKSHCVCSCAQRCVYTIKWKALEVFGFHFVGSAVVFRAYFEVCQVFGQLCLLGGSSASRAPRCPQDLDPES